MSQRSAPWWTRLPVFKVKASVTDGSGLANGSSVKLYVTSDKAQQVMTVPVDAVYYDNGNPYVYTFDQGIVHKTDVEIGISDSKSMEITSGLTESDNVITTWSPELYEGAPAVLEPASEETAE